MINSNEIEYVVTVKYGHVQIRSWFEERDGKLVGMGSKVEYDELGKVIGYSETETGLTLTI